jgi:hypothetical protein
MVRIRFGLGVSAGLGGDPSYLSVVVINRSGSGSE